MKIKNVELSMVCGITSKLPETDRVELAFAGKSNVGKSLETKCREIFKESYPEVQQFDNTSPVDLDISLGQHYLFFTACSSFINIQPVFISSSCLLLVKQFSPGNPVPSRWLCLV